MYESKRLKLGDNIMTELHKVLSKYKEQIEDITKARNEKRANNPVWFNRSKQVDGVWTDNPIAIDKINESMDDGYIVNMFIKDVEDKDNVLTTTLADLLKDKLMLALGTERECKNNTLRYMVVSTEE